MPDLSVEIHFRQPESNADDVKTNVTGPPLQSGLGVDRATEVSGVHAADSRAWEMKANSSLMITAKQFSLLTANLTANVAD